MFSNRSVKLFTLKNHFLMRVKALHPMRMCLTVQGVWQDKHCGCCSCFSMKKWVSLVWPMRSRDIMTCFLLDFLKAGLYSPKVGWIWKSLLMVLLFQCCCHFMQKNLLIWGFRSVYGILNLLEVRSKADLASESPLSFSFTPMWLWIQHIRISLQFDIESSLLKFNDKKILKFLFLNDSKTESESENMINFFMFTLRWSWELDLLHRLLLWRWSFPMEWPSWWLFYLEQLHKLFGHCPLNHP